MSYERIIVGLGEALVDLFADRSAIGGAPLNMAIHAQQLGDHAVLVSRIGQDGLGGQVVALLRERGVDISHLQTDPDKPTGTSRVDVSDPHHPRFEVVADVAWDAIQYDGDLDYLAKSCHGVCFGTLGQRSGQSRTSIGRFLASAAQAVRLLDVNLRPPFFDRQLLTRSFEAANAAKLNGEELVTVSRLFNLPAEADQAAMVLLRRFNLAWLAVTRGEKGTMVYTPAERFETPPVQVDTSRGDAVGAGDATVAALMHGALRQWEWPRTLKLANAVGAWVASQPGACPKLDESVKVLAAD